jgi:DNA-binding HxlR family transcriptional regulator
LLDRTVIDARPPRVEYRLTDRGREFGAVVRAFAQLA